MTLIQQYEKPALLTDGYGNTESDRERRMMIRAYRECIMGGMVDYHEFVTCFFNEQKYEEIYNDIFAAHIDRDESNDYYYMLDYIDSEIIDRMKEYGEDRETATTEVMTELVDEEVNAFIGDFGYADFFEFFEEMGLCVIYNCRGQQFVINTPQIELFKIHGEEYLTHHYDDGRQRILEKTFNERRYGDLNNMEVVINERGDLVEEGYNDDFFIRRWK